MRTAMFGGSFNPVHNGHVALAKAFSKQLEIDRLLVIPTFLPPHKQHDTSVTPQARLEMCRLAFSNMPNAEVSDIEIKRGGASYTYLTLQALREIYPKDELFLIMGADMFLSVQSWKNPEIIFSLATVCGVPRNRSRIEELTSHAEYLQALGAKAEVLDADIITVSSTMLREKLCKNENVEDLIPKDVEDYIKTNNLYHTVK